jgi:CheY-like chemotaxis protein
MTEEVKQNLFQPFFTTKEPGKGTGLGLATVYGLLLQAKGTIEVESTPGRGTRFELRFPRADAAARATRITSKPAPRLSTAAPPRAGTILLAEDEPIVRQSVSRMLRRGGYHLIEARTGKEALALFAKHKHEIDLALLDVVMPELSGPEAAIRLRAESPSLKILFMSGYPRDLFEANAEARNLGPMIQKPMTEATLLAAVQSVLEATEEDEDEHR